MQIYFTDPDPAQCAANLPDQHTIKILLEVAQIICTVNSKYGLETPYEPTHKNHPLVLWAGRSANNWNWLWQYTQFLNREYQIAYQTSNNHKSFLAVADLLPPQELSGKPFTEPSKVFKKGSFYDWPTKDIIQLGRDETHIAYQKYLDWKVNKFKQEGKCFRLYSWTNRPTPDFIKLEF